MDAISLEAAAAMTGLSRRTLWRRVTDGVIQKSAEDGRGRAMLALSGVVDLIDMQLEDDDLEMLIHADAGEASAQADVGEMFYVAGLFESAVYWLRLAADQGNADAMQWLGNCHAAGMGVPQDDNLSIMWIAKAAAAGNLIAQHQMRSLMPPAPHLPSS